MLRLRFEKAEQVFLPRVPFASDFNIILPPVELIKYLKTEGSVSPESVQKEGREGQPFVMPWLEIPAVIWPQDEENVRKELDEAKLLGVTDAVAENIGAIELALEYGFNVHGGFTLNAYNSNAIDQYAVLGLEDITVSFEMALSDYRRLKTKIPAGLVTYGYLPLMKFRNCPVRAESGCRKCGGLGSIRDRKNEVFPVICRRKRYSELLNCVPLYLGDKSLPETPFELLYFTIETRQEVQAVIETYLAGDAPDFRRTAGLYYRDVL